MTILKSIASILFISTIVFLGVNQWISNYCYDFEDFVYWNSYDGKQRPYDVCMTQNYMPILRLPDIELLQYPNWNSSGVWVK